MRQQVNTTTTIMAPTVTSVNDLHDICEFSEQSTGEFRYTFFTVIHDEVVYFGRVGLPRDKVTLEQFTAALTPVPDSDIFPKHPTSAGEHFTVADDEDLPEGGEEMYYIKRPRFSMYDIFREEDVFSVLPGLILDEARALQKISRRPHPNIVRYHGCRVRRSRITGLVFDRHPHDLEVHVRNGVGKVDIEPFMGALESAINHLHRLGWAHNDLNPSNVLVAEDGRPVLVDFGSTKRIGCKLTTSRGTPGWMEEGDAYHTSEKSHDLFALEKIRAWLHENQI
jgi:serine/threonine protein kinase